MIDNQSLQNQIQQLRQQVDTNNLLFKNHTHDATTSFRILPTDLTNYNYYYAVSVVQLTPAFIKNLFTQYQILIPAQGLNNVIIVEGITTRIYYGGTAYAGANNLEFRYTNAAGAKVTADMVNTFINSTTSVYDHVAGVTTELTPVANAPIVVAVPTANPTTGNSNITFWIKYRIVNL